MSKYLIWSYEHKAWWRSNSSGYTYNPKDAGLYAKSEAKKIVDGLHSREEMLPARPILQAFRVYLNCLADNIPLCAAQPKGGEGDD